MSDDDIPADPIVALEHEGARLIAASRAARERGELKAADALLWAAGEYAEAVAILARNRGLVVD